MRNQGWVYEYDDGIWKALDLSRVDTDDQSGWSATGGLRWPE